MKEYSFKTSGLLLMIIIVMLHFDVGRFSMGEVEIKFGGGA